MKISAVMAKVEGAVLYVATVVVGSILCYLFPLSQILELNKRMSAIERMLNRLEEKILVQAEEV